MPNYIEKINMKFNTQTLDKLIVALLSSGYNTKFVANVKHLFKLFTENSVNEDVEKAVRVYIIGKLCTLILAKGIRERSVMLELLSLDGKYENEAIEIMNSLYKNELGEKDIIILDNAISSQLKYAIIDSRAQAIVDLSNDLLTSNYTDFDTAINTYGELINSLNSDLKRANESIEDSKNDVSFSDSGLLSNLKAIIDEEKNPNARIKTGIIALNSMLNGGWERGRLYVILGLLKGFKSGLLLNTAIWAKRYNRIATKDPNKQPVVLYITLENSVKETIKRMVVYSCGDKYDLKNHSEIEVARQLQETGLFTPEDSKSTELDLKYRSRKSVSVDDINSLCEDYERDGKEVVFIVLDYLKRLKPNNANKDLRIQLGDITDELAALAKERDIPIVSAMQLNRIAITAYDEATDVSAKMNAINRMGNSQIGESIDIGQNADYTFVINLIDDTKYDENGSIEYRDKYLNIKCTATRDKYPDVLSFTHRFEDGNGLRLAEDLPSGRSQSLINSDDVIKTSIDKEKKVQPASGKRQPLSR